MTRLPRQMATAPRGTPHSSSCAAGSGRPPGRWPGKTVPVIACHAAGPARTAGHRGPSGPAHGQQLSPGSSSLTLRRPRTDQEVLHATTELARAGRRRKESAIGAAPTQNASSKQESCDHESSGSWLCAGVISMRLEDGVSSAMSGRVHPRRYLKSSSMISAPWVRAGRISWR